MLDAPVPEWLPAISDAKGYRPDSLESQIWENKPIPDDFRDTVQKQIMRIVFAENGIGSLTSDSSIIELKLVQSETNLQIRMIWVRPAAQMLKVFSCFMHAILLRALKFGYRTLSIYDFSSNMESVIGRHFPDLFTVVGRDFVCDLSDKQQLIEQKLASNPFFEVRDQSIILYNDFLNVTAAQLNDQEWQNARKPAAAARGT